MDLSFIQTVRKQKQLSIKELAWLTKLTSGYISRIEKNKTNAKIKDIITICKVLDYDLIAKDKINKHKLEEYIITTKGK